MPQEVWTSAAPTSEAAPANHLKKGDPPHTGLDLRTKKKKLPTILGSKLRMEDKPVHQNGWRTEEDVSSGIKIMPVPQPCRREVIQQVQEGKEEGREEKERAKERQHMTTPRQAYCAPITGSFHGSHKRKGKKHAGYNGSLKWGHKQSYTQNLTNVGEHGPHKKKAWGKGTEWNTKNMKNNGNCSWHTPKKQSNTLSAGGERKIAKYIENWAELGWTEEDSAGKQATVQTFRMVGRTGRNRDETAPSLWVVKFRSDIQKGREMYEETIRNNKELEQILQIKVRRDTGPKDFNEWALEAHMQHLAIEDGNK